MYIDGYIAKTLGPRETHIYFTRLLQSTGRYIQLHMSTSDNVFFIIHPALQHAEPSAFIAERPAWLLDYKMRNNGTVVPQSIWTPGDVQRYAKVSRMPIFFVLCDRMTPGLQLVQAAAGHGMRLRDAHAPAPVGSAYTTCILLKVTVSQFFLIMELLCEHRLLLVVWLRRTVCPNYN